MSTPVWPFALKFDVGVSRRRVYDETNLILAPGIIKTVMREVAVSRADATGSVTSHKGADIIKIRLNRKIYGAQFDTILDFLVARKQNNNEPFYLYNPIENSDGDDTGVETAGRNKWVFLGEIEWILYTWNAYNFAEIELHEVIT